MSSLLIKFNVATNNVPVSKVPVSPPAESEAKEDLEQIQCDMAAMQKEIQDTTNARLAAAKVRNEKKWLDQEEQDTEKVEADQKVEAQRMAQQVSLWNLSFWTQS